MMVVGIICLYKQCIIVTKMVDFVGHLCSNRAFSSPVYDSPPFAYAALLSSNIADKQSAVDAMQRDNKLLHALEALP